jgi:pyrroline-5-carboxylate reductase
MGGALLKGWLAQGLGPLAIIEPAPHPEIRSLMRRHAIRLLPSAKDVGNLDVGTCVVALKPQILRTEAEWLKPVAESGALMLSIAAGTTIARLHAAWDRKAFIVRAMPNPPGAIGRGITALYAPPHMPEVLRARAETLVAGLGETIWVRNERLIDAVTAVSGSGPAYVFLMTECLARAARAQGLSTDTATRLARATISGAGAMLEADPRDAAKLRRDVTSPGGTTEAALRVLMEDDALEKLMIEAVSAARARATELGRQSEL